MTTYELHPLCTLFPRMSDVEFEALKNDISANGLDEPITLHDGMILDGGHRYRACIELGISPKITKYNGLDPVMYVLTKNLIRRHLSAGQRAAIVALAADWGRSHGHGGDRKSQGATSPLDRQEATLPLDSVQARAARSDAGRRTQKDADKVAREAPKLAAQVAAGEISLPKAVEQVRPKQPAAPKVDELAAAKQTVTELQEQLADLSDVARDLQMQIEGQADKRIEQLRAELKATQATRDIALRENAALKREVKRLQRRLGEAQ